MAREFEVNLSPDECKAAAEFEQEALDVIYKSLLDLALPSRISGTKEIEEVGVLEDLVRHVRVSGRQRGLEVGEGLPVTLVGSVLDLQGKDVVGPARLCALARVPEALVRGAELLEQRDLMGPGNLCKRLLHNCSVGPRGRKSAHVLEVARREATHVGVRFAEVRCQAVDHLRSPPLVLLAREDHAPDVPVQQDHGRARGHDDAEALLLDAPFDLLGRPIAALGARLGREHLLRDDRERRGSTLSGSGSSL